MKHIASLVFLSLYFSFTSFGQTTLGDAEKELTQKLCDCISGLDMDQISEKTAANKAFMDCFTQQTNLVVKMAEERGADITDRAAMRELGVGIGKNLLNINCPNYVVLSTRMAENASGENTGTTEGKLKRIDTKDFNYFVMTDLDNNEKSFIWLRQFPGSEQFMNVTGKTKNEKVRIGWREIEVFIPSAKNYYKIKEVVSLELF